MLTMKNFGKEVVKALEVKGKKIFIARDGDDYYISDSYIAIKTNEDMYSLFRQAFAKHSIVPELEEQDCLMWKKGYAEWEKANKEAFLPSFRDFFIKENYQEDAYLTNFTYAHKKDKLSIIKTDKIRVIKNKQAKIIEGCTLKASEKAVLAIGDFYSVVVTFYFGTGFIGEEIKILAELVV